MSRGQIERTIRRLWRQAGPNGSATAQIKDYYASGGGGYSPYASGGYRPYGAVEHITPGSGGNWADGWQFSDWSPNGGSATYRALRSQGFVDLGGKLFQVLGGGVLAEVLERNGEVGYYETYDDVDYSQTYTNNGATYRGVPVVGARFVSIQAQQGVIITVTDDIVGNTVVKGYPNQVLDEKGEPVIYEVPLYEVRVSGYDEGKYVSETFKAIRFGVYHNSKTGSGPFVTRNYEGVYAGEWETHSKLGNVIRVLGAGNGHVLFHVGPSNGYVPGANGCIEIFGAGQFEYFQAFVNNLAGGATNNIRIKFEGALVPPLVPYNIR
ncbi:MAG: hypothetical protein ACOYXT_00785 [Bacteroidota bacterium]